MIESNCNTKSKMLILIKELCSLIKSCQVLGLKKETNSNRITTNFQSCWLKERTASHINHRHTFSESCQLDNENTFQESEITGLILKEGILKFKSKMQERSQSGEIFSQFIAMGKVNSTQLTFTFTFNQPTQ